MTTLEEQFQDLITHIETAGQLARDYFDSQDISNEVKSDGSVVTRIDMEIETVLRDYIAKHFPNDAIIGEEHDDMEGTSGFVWHLDPIDGTDNFLRKIPFCAISVARLGETAEDSFGIVHNPITKHTFASLMENGAYENERLTNLTADPLGGRYTITVGRGRESWMKSAGNNIITACDEKYGRGLRYGSTALELAYLSAGRIDGFITFGLSTYDYAAGLFLVRAAGGAISVFENDTWKIWEGSIKELCDVHKKIIFASHPDIHEDIRDFIGNPRTWSSEKS
jgi:myo-inositol-1(or 4)-monophosphatase